MDDIVGKDGMEKALRGLSAGRQDGSRSIETTSTGKVTNVLSTVDPVLGSNCVLTLDIRLQEAAEKALAEIVPKLREEGKTNKRWGGENAKGAAVVAIDVRTGDVLAMASYPTFHSANYSKDYNTLLKDPLKPLFNRAVSGCLSAGLHLQDGDGSGRPILRRGDRQHRDSGQGYLHVLRARLHPYVRRVQDLSPHPRIRRCQRGDQGFLQLLFL